MPSGSQKSFSNTFSFNDCISTLYCISYSTRLIQRTRFLKANYRLPNLAVICRDCRVSNSLATCKGGHWRSPRANWSPSKYICRSRSCSWVGERSCWLFGQRSHSQIYVWPMYPSWGRWRTWGVWGSNTLQLQGEKRKLVKLDALYWFASI